MNQILQKNYSIMQSKLDQKLVKINNNHLRNDTAPDNLTTIATPSEGTCFIPLIPLISEYKKVEKVKLI